MPEAGGSSAEAKKRNARRGIGVLLSVVGLLMGVVGIVLALLGEGVSVAVDGTGLVFGLVGYVFGARTIAVVTIVVCTLSLFLGLAVSQGLIPGIGGYTRG